MSTLKRSVCPLVNPSALLCLSKTLPLPPARLLKQICNLVPRLALGLRHKEEDEDAAGSGDRREDEVAGGGLKERSNLELSNII